MVVLIRIFLLLWTSLCLAAPMAEDQAFVFSAQRQDANSIELHWTIKPNYFLYQQRVSIDSLSHDHLQVGTIHYPEPQIKLNQQHQQVLVYRDTLALNVPVLSSSGGEYLITVHYQGCSDEGYCYPPQSRCIKLSFNSDNGLTAVSQETQLAEPTAAIAQAPHLNAPSLRAESLLNSARLVWVMLSFFGFGLLLAFTPCVFPMIPVISGIIVGQGHQVSTRRAFLLSLSYVLSMSMTYGIVGAVIASIGTNLQVLLQSSWAIGGFSLIFVLLALSMFDIYTLRLPVEWQSKWANLTRNQAHGHYLSAALMGALSILILSPCVTPPLMGVLSYIAETHAVLRGLLALFCLGLGMGTPLLLIGTSAGKLLPKAGLWMNTVKGFFGILLLGVAIHLLSRLISPFLTMVLWSALLITSGMSLKPFSAYSNRSIYATMTHVLGLMLVAYGVLILYGASAGHTDPWKPLVEPSLKSAQATQVPKVVKTLPEALLALEKAQQNHQAVILDFYATWCDSCQYIEKTTLNDPSILAFDAQIQIIRVDLSENGEAAQRLLRYFKVVAPPSFLFYDANGQSMPDLHWEGILDVQDLVMRIQQAIHHTD